MLKILDEYFKEFPARKKVVETLYNYGLSIKEGKIFLGEMEVPISVIARYANVNRKIVYHTIEFIQKDYALRSIMERLSPEVNLSTVAPLMGWEVIEVVTPAGQFGCIMTELLRILSSQSCSIRQVIAMDAPEGQGKIQIIMEGSIPVDALEMVRDIEGVNSITIKTPEKDKEKLVCHHCKVLICNRRI